MKILIEQVLDKLIIILKRKLKNTVSELSHFLKAIVEIEWKMIHSFYDLFWKNCRKIPISDIFTQ